MVCGSGAVVCSWSLLIRGSQRARRQAETPLIVLRRFPGPALTPITGTDACCPRAVAGHTAAPLSSVMNLRLISLDHLVGEGKQHARYG